MKPKPMKEKIVKDHARPTPEEMDILNQAAEIRYRLSWLRAHPGRTRRDYAKNFDGEVMQWRRGQGEAAIARERARWLRDHPGDKAADYDRITSCAASDTDVAAYAAWRDQR
jgi:hypothetical protein